MATFSQTWISDEFRGGLARRLRCSVIVMAVCAIALILVLQATFHHAVRSRNEMQRAHDARVAIEQILSSMRGAEALLHGYLLTRRPEARERYVAARDNVHERYRAALDLTAGVPAQNGRLARLKPLLEEKTSRLDRAVRLLELGDPGAASDIVGSPRALELSLRAEALAREMQSFAAEQIQRCAIWGRTFQTLLIMGGFAVGGVLLLLLARQMRDAGQAARRERGIEHHLRRLSGERTELLREINHRVGNSLSMVTSLIEMQARRIEDPRVLNEFLDARNRIVALGQVHRRLQKENAVAALDAGDYLRDLCSDLAQSLDAAGGIRVRATSAILPVEKVVPLALVVNELVTNAMRHGCAPSGRGRVDVTLSWEGGDLVLAVRDPGLGLQDTEEAGPKSHLGMTIVRALTGQLSGKLEFRHDAGHEVRITFPPNAPV